MSDSSPGSHRTCPDLRRSVYLAPKLLTLFFHVPVEFYLYFFIQCGVVVLQNVEHFQSAEMIGDLLITEIILLNIVILDNGWIDVK